MADPGVVYQLEISPNQELLARRAAELLARELEWPWLNANGSY